MDVSKTSETSSVLDTHSELAALAGFERSALVMLAAAPAALTRAEWVNQLRLYGVRKPGLAASAKAGKSAHDLEVSKVDLVRLVARVAGRGLLVETTPGSYACPFAAKHVLLDDPSHRELLERMRVGLGRIDAPLYEWRGSNAQGKLQAARLALYCRAPDEAAALFAQAKSVRRVEVDPVFYMALLDPRSPVEALSLMSPELRAEYASQVLSECLPRLCLPGVDMLAALAREASDPGGRCFAVIAAALSGEPGDAESWLVGDESALSFEARAVLALQRREPEVARELAVQACQASDSERSKGKRQKPLLSSPFAPLLALLLATGVREQAALAHAQLARVTHKGRLPTGYLALAIFLRIADVQPRHDYAVIRVLSDDLELLCVALVTLFLDDTPHRSSCRELQRRCATYRAAGAHWLAAEAEGALARLGYQSMQLEAASGNRAGLVDLYKPEAPWERSLSLLEQLAPTDDPPAAMVSASQVAERRLVFLVRIVAREVTTQDQRKEPTNSAPMTDGADLTDQGATSQPEQVFENTLVIEPRLQTRRASGYTAGRAVALRTLFEASGETDHITAEDRRIIACIQSQKAYWGGREFFFSARAPLALIDHPHVFWMDRPEGPAVPVVKQAARLCARRGEHGFYLRVEPFANAAGIGVMADAEHRLLVTELTLPQLNVQRTISELPPVPADGEGRLRQVLGRLSTLFTVESQVGVDAVDQVSADSRIVLQLARAEPGLRVRVGVAPLGLLGPRFAPGLGTTTVAAEIERKRLSCTRDLEAERRALETLMAAAPALRNVSGSTALALESLPVCLELLQTLSTLHESVIVEWPAGVPLVVAGTADLSSLRLTLGEEASWLTAAGTLAVDEGRVLQLMEVLERRTPDGAFVMLGDDQYLALSNELQQGLAALEAAASSSDDEALRVPPVALGFVSPWLKKLRATGGLKTDKRLAKQLARIEKAYDATYCVPPTFQAELRAYQVVGFEFLARLGQLGAGACLADDMGLGKTLMTLALLVARAEAGPALIVAPTSVRANWFDEALRFAPTLRMLRAEDLSLASLQPFDVVVTSYTLMAQRIEQLERVRFATAVLDEAQAIKNAATQRGRAASRLVADARVALTGTPVENHLGDLYGIMSYLNPGLLGDAKAFEVRFAKPIQRERDARAKTHLRTLIAPFVLRRRKSDVLRELPPRTEITLRVEPEAEERAFTEALRRAALQRLTASSQDENLARSTVSILAEITRLRRAACHPQLVDPSANVGAAKLECLVDVVRELKEGGHRALIFSQFVDFLKLVRTRLETEGTSCQYLDGSTPEKARHRAVMEFQSGKGDMFLISLKAGGFGLNLTAADYVIHLDPWWNPAVEAQASDRAHRIGQQRPVTIYRLVNAASIEERVLSLHERKQTLAEEILSDSAEVTRLDPNALLALLAD